MNALSSSDPEEFEKLAGMSHLNGIPIRIEPVRGSGNGAERHTEELAAAPTG